MGKLLMRTFIAAVVGVLVASGPALAKDPSSGSKEKKNEVTCGKSTVGQGSLKVYADSGHLEVCNDGNTTPAQGRIMVWGSPTSGGSVAIDGDESNPEGASRGYFRLNIDGSGPSYQCGDSDDKDADGKGGLDAYNPTKNETSADCG